MGLLLELVKKQKLKIGEADLRKALGLFRYFPPPQPY